MISRKTYCRALKLLQTQENFAAESRQILLTLLRDSIDDVFLGVMNHPLQRSRQNLSRRCVVFVAERIELFFHICVKQNRDGHKIFAADMLRSAVFSGDEIVKRFRFVQIPPLAFIFGPDTKIVCFRKPPRCVVANIVDAVTSAEFAETLRQNSPAFAIVSVPYSMFFWKSKYTPPFVV